MQDGIIAETGNSRYLRTVAGIKAICPTYDSFLELLVKGEFPIDLLRNDQDGWTTRGTYLNKTNLLTDATAALVDLGKEATPDQMFAALANAAKNKITYGTESLTDGVSELPTGTIYIKIDKGV